VSVAGVTTDGATDHITQDGATGRTQRPAIFSLAGSAAKHIFRRSTVSVGGERAATAEVLQVRSMMVWCAWVGVELLGARMAAAGVLPGSISGAVLDSVSGKPLNYANVVVIGTTHGTMARSSGRFTLEGLDPGTYDLRASFIGYAPQTIQVRVFSQQTASVEFRLHKGAQHNFILSRIKVVRGPGTCCGCRRNETPMRLDAARVDDPLHGRGVRLLPGESDEPLQGEPRTAAGCCVVSEQASHPSEGALELDLLLNAHADGRDLASLVRT
jgi:hypothetical protein